jgi:DNA-binding MurR/RpiR family transcriptional regulator
MRELLGELADSNDPKAGTKGDKLIKRWLEFGMRNHNALRDIIEQLEGKPKQQIEAEVNDSDSKEMREALKLVSTEALDEFAKALRTVREKEKTK